jgi:predicted TIM-barrel fold metal-dependent hydrolase
MAATDRPGGTDGCTARTANSIALTEEILEPELPIVDPHHHLWLLPKSEIAKLDSSTWSKMLRSHARYLLDEFLADVNTGHNIQATVYIQCESMYRAQGPEAMKSLGEVEFANGVAAMTASGLFGEVKVCAGIVGAPDLMLGDAVEEVLHAHIQAADGRYRGVRTGNPDQFRDKKFRTGFRWLHKFGLSFDTYTQYPKLPELIDLARSFPETSIVLNHVGVPIGVGGGQFLTWRDHIYNIAKCQNVVVKLGGLGSTDLQGFKTYGSNPPATSEQLAVEWKPFIETCIEAFGTDRCMFESDFPPGSSSYTYPVVWNTFKRLAANASKEEKTALFSGTARHVYRMNA